MPAKQANYEFRRAKKKNIKLAGDLQSIFEIPSEHLNSVERELLEDEEILDDEENDHEPQSEEDDSYVRRKKMVVAKEPTPKNSPRRDDGKIIVAEDQLHNLQVIKQQLTQLGKLDRCEFVYNGEEAVVKFSELVSRNEKVSYILTDFMMPRLNGQQAVERIRGFITKRNLLNPQN